MTAQIVTTQAPFGRIMIEIRDPNPRITEISWPALEAAAEQESPEPRKRYSMILAAARQVKDGGPNPGPIDLDEMPEWRVTVYGRRALADGGYGPFATREVVVRAYTTDEARRAALLPESQYWRAGMWVPIYTSPNVRPANRAAKLLLGCVD